jgi:hypothetical protein
MFTFKKRMSGIEHFSFASVSTEGRHRHPWTVSRDSEQVTACPVTLEVSARLIRWTISACNH